MNVEIGTEAVQFPEKEYINGILVTVHNLVLSLLAACVVGFADIWPVHVNSIY